MHAFPTSPFRPPILRSVGATPEGREETSQPRNRERKPRAEGGRAGACKAWVFDGSTSNCTSQTCCYMRKIKLYLGKLLSLDFFSYR